MGLTPPSWDVLPLVKGTFELCRIYEPYGCGCSISAELLSNLKHKRRRGINMWNYCDYPSCRLTIDDEKVEIIRRGYCDEIYDIDLVVAKAISLITKKVKFVALPLKLPSGKIAVITGMSEVIAGRGCSGTCITLSIGTFEGKVIKALLDHTPTSYVTGRLVSIKISFYDSYGGSIKIESMVLEPAVNGCCLRLSTKNFAKIFEKGLKITIKKSLTRKDIENAIFILDYLSAHTTKQ